jgi:hypothetical protein
LPTIFNEIDYYNGLAFLPKYSPAQTESIEVRMECANLISQIYQPLPINIIIGRVISSLLRSGYVGRNPLTIEGKKSLYGSVNMVSADTMLLTGLSGTGKSQSVTKLLNMYDPVIHHTVYRGQPLNFTQITWMKLNSSYDGSLGGLVLSFFSGIDELLGYTDTSNSYFDQYAGRRVTIDAQLNGWERVAKTHFLGLLFIDELQNLYTRDDSSTDKHQKEKALKFILKLSNIKIPSILCGGPECTSLISNKFMVARRVTSGGHVEIPRMTSWQQPEWINMIVPAIWKYQWVPQPAPLTDDLTKLLYDLTQGIPGLLASLCKNAQRLAISLDLPTVNDKVILQAAKQWDSTVRDGLDAIRSGNPRKIRAYIDLAPAQTNHSMLTAIDQHPAQGNFDDQKDLEPDTPAASAEQVVDSEKADDPIKSLTSKNAQKQHQPINHAAQLESIQASVIKIDPRDSLSG